jgi:mono/diheme cytochrome c family protein
VNRDFRTYIVLLAFSLPVIALLFIGSIYFTNCGVNNDCTRGNLAQVIHTSIPTLPAATLPAPTQGIPATQTLSATEVAAAGQTVTPAAAGNEVPRPSNPGGPGDAIHLAGDPSSGATLFQANCAPCHGDKGVGGIPNPGSTDGTVPPLNPIDPLLKDPDPATFAYNLDLFIQHGSTPEGTNPFRVMPPWGDQAALTQQQIADLIAYLISLNK